IDVERRGIHEAAGEEALNEEQQTRWEALDAAEAEVREQLAVAEERAARAKRVAESRARWGSLQVGEKVPTDDVVDVARMGRREAVDRALKRAEESAKSVELRAEQEQRVERLIRSTAADTDGSHIARRLLLTENDDYRSA